MESGIHLGPYEILEPLGAGGMGEVYLARDPRLEREVAIKVLPEALAADPEQLARLEREARMLAALDHPNVAAVYGLEEAGGVRFLVMQRVPGETLADRIAVGQIPAADAEAIAAQIALGLEAAHERGIVHRDLKPANVMVDDDGNVKILDFGLAKPTGEVSAHTDGQLTASPTVMAATATGVIMGTAAYMSPEQARGKPVDKRTDIWAFGVVLYEMLCGRRPFQGATVSDYIAAILTQEPDHRALPAAARAATRRLIARCLHKDPKTRLRDIGEARVVLSGDPAADLDEVHVAVHKPGRLSDFLLVAGLVVAAAALAFVLGRGMGEPAPEIASVEPRRFALATPGAGAFEYTFWPSLAIAPQGRTIAYATRTGLYVQDLETGEGALLAATQGASAPFFSPDGSRVAYFQQARLRHMSVDGGTPTDVAETGWGHPGGAWRPDGSILYLPQWDNDMWEIAPGGVTRQLPSPESAWNVFYPEVLPDTDRILVTDTSGDTDTGFSVIEPETGRAIRVLEDAFAPHYVSTGHLVFVRGQEIMAATFDLDTLDVGEETVLATDIVTNWGEGFAELGVSRTGTIVYLSAPPGGHTLQRLEPGRAPQVLNSRPLTIDYIGIQLSPTGDRVLSGDSTGDLWSYGIERGVVERLSQTENYEFRVVWRGAGEEIAYVSLGAEGRQVRLMDLPTGEETLLHRSGDVNSWPYDFSPDGSTLLIGVQAAGAAVDLYLLTVGSDEPLRPFLESPATKLSAEFSPNGRWIAYASDETGQFEVHMRSYPDGVERRVVSIAGGVHPRFAADGSAIFYSSGPDVLRVPVLDANTMRLGAPEAFVTGVDGDAWEVLADGSAVIAVAPRAMPELRVILDATSLFESR